MAGFQSFQETFIIKMDLLHGHFYKTIKEAETGIKQYSKEDYFIRLNRPRRIKFFLFVGNRPQRINNILFVGNRPRRINKLVFVGIPDE